MIIGITRLFFHFFITLFKLFKKSIKYTIPVKDYLKNSKDANVVCKHDSFVFCFPFNYQVKKSFFCGGYLLNNLYWAKIFFSACLTLCSTYCYFSISTILTICFSLFECRYMCIMLIKIDLQTWFRKKYRILFQNRPVTNIYREKQIFASRRSLFFFSKSQSVSMCRAILHV